LAAKRMVVRSMEQFDLYPDRLIGDSAYGSAEMLNWLVHDQGIEPHIPVFDKSSRRDGSFQRSDFAYDHKRDCYICPAGKELSRYRQQGRAAKAKPPVDGLYRYRSVKDGLRRLHSQAAMLPDPAAAQGAALDPRGATRPARDIPKPRPTRPRAASAKRSRCCFAHLKRILKLDRLRLRGPNGARDEFHLAAAAQNLRKLAKLVPIAAAIRAT